MPTVDCMRKWDLERLRNDLRISEFIPDLKQPRLALDHDLGYRRVIRAHFLRQTKFTISHMKETDIFLVILLGYYLRILYLKVDCSKV